MADELLSCPFCGGDANADGHVRYSRPLTESTWEDGSPITEAFFVNCIKCQAAIRSATIGGYQHRAEAIAAWNRRTAPTPATDEMREAVAQWCSGCHEVRSVDCYRAGCPKSDTERRAAEILAAEARGREVEAAAIMDWLCDTYDPDDEHDERLDIAQAIEVVRHIKHGAGK